MVAQVGYSVIGRSRGQMAPCTVCIVYVETMSVSFLVEPQNQGRRFVSGLAQYHLDDFFRFGLKTGGDGFPGLVLKTGSSCLVIWASKLPRRFLDLGLKIKWASVYRLHHKTNGRRMMQDTRRDLVAWFTSKQVVLGFPNLSSRMAEARR
jgi:hypothetical protein